MRIRNSKNDWQEKMYDREHANKTLGSKKLKLLAKKEVEILISTLALKRGQNILDAPCGTGRHSSLFASHGLKVTGIDISEGCLKIARSQCKLKSVTFSKGNIGNLSAYRGRFDAVVNLFSSFGYFATDQENEQVLNELISTLKPGGKIAIHLIDRDWLMKVFTPTCWSEKSRVLTLEARRYDPKSHYNEAHTVVVDKRSGKAKTYFHRMRLYSKPEMVTLMKRCGLKKIRVIGDLKGSAYKKGISTHPIYTGESP